MQERCAKHVFAGAEGGCGTCGRGSSAPNASSTPSVRSKPPLCIPCAVAAAGIRASAGEARHLRLPALPPCTGQERRARDAIACCWPASLTSTRRRHSRIAQQRADSTYERPAGERVRVRLSRFPGSRQWSGGVAPLVVCSKCGERNEDGQEFCRNQACGAYLPFVQGDAPAPAGPGPVAPQQPQRAAPPRPPQKRGVRIALSQSIGTVTPGESVDSDVDDRQRRHRRRAVRDLGDRHPAGMGDRATARRLADAGGRSGGCDSPPSRSKFRHHARPARLLRVHGLDRERRSLRDCVGIVRGRDVRGDRRRAHTTTIRDGSPGAGIASPSSTKATLRSC